MIKDVIREYETLRDMNISHNKHFRCYELLMGSFEATLYYGNGVNLFDIVEDEYRYDSDYTQILLDLESAANRLGYVSIEDRFKEITGKWIDEFSNIDIIFNVHSEPFLDIFARNALSIIIYLEQKTIKITHPGLNEKETIKETVELLKAFEKYGFLTHEKSNYPLYIWEAMEE